MHDEVGLRIREQPMACGTIDEVVVATARHDDIAHAPSSKRFNHKATKKPGPRR